MQSNFTKPKLVKYEDLSKSWYVYFFYNGTKKVFKKGINYIQSYDKRLKEANALADALLDRLKKGWNPLIPDIYDTSSELTLLAALDFALEKKKPNIGVKTFSGYCGSVKFVKTAIESLGLEFLPVQKVKRIHVKTILEKIKLQRSASNNSYNKYLDHFRAVLSELIQWDIIPINPANNIKNLPVAESLFYTPATAKENEIIKNELQKNHLTFFNFLATLVHTGIRPEEILKIQLDMIDLLRSQIVLPAEITKTNKPRIVPINKHLQIIFQSMNFESLPKVYYLFGSFREVGRGNVGAKLDFICGPTKLKRDTATKRWNRIVIVGLQINVKMYSYKHFGANAKILAGMTMEALKELYGHTSVLTTAIYATKIKEVRRIEIMELSPDF